MTIDGYKDAHDKLRPLLNGKPAFDKIFENLIQTRNVTNNFFMSIRSNVMPDNLDSIKKFLDLASNYFSTDRRYLLHFFP